jgi:glutathione synthase/RimK-type ligase-like ATP-grasp enzyme
MRNSTRYIVRYLQRFAERNDIALTRLSDDWILLLERNDVRHVVFGYDIGLNPSTAQRVANDKAATYDILTLNRIAALPHLVFLHPRFAKHLSFDGNWSKIIATFEEWNRDVVVKPNEGTGGLGVTRARSNFQLELAVHSILTSEPSIALSPFTPIVAETRVFVLDGQALLAYEKKLPSVVGDGVSALSQLMERQLGRPTVAKVLEDRAASSFELDLGQVPAAGMRVAVHWKHNLGQGANPELLDLTALPKAVTLATQAAHCIGLRFGTVDIVETAQDLMVLEINAGVMMEAVADSVTDWEALLDRIYGAALSRIFPPA